MQLFQSREFDANPFPFTGELMPMDFLLIAAMGTAVLLALFERASRSPQGPAWSLLLGVPWIALVTSFLLDRIFALSWSINGFYEATNSPAIRTQQLGEIAISLLAISCLRVIASRAKVLQLLRTFHHLFTGSFLLIVWIALDRHAFHIAKLPGGPGITEELSFASFPAMVASLSGLAIGSVCVGGSVLLVIWNRLRQRSKPKIVQVIS